MKEDLPPFARRPTRGPDLRGHDGEDDPEQQRPDDERRPEDQQRPDDEQQPAEEPPRRRRRPIREEPRGVWLVIRYDAADAGARPIPDGEVFWLSPDIWISPADELGNAIDGEPTTVHARVWNLGNFQAVPTRVDFSFVDAALGIPWHAPQLIGTAWVSIPPLGTVEVECPEPWIPVTTASHPCLLVTCTTHLDPNSAPTAPKWDRHTGQRNVTVVQGRSGGELAFELTLAPVLGHVAPMQLAASAMRLEPQRVAELPVGARLLRSLERLGRMGLDRQQRLEASRALALARQLPGMDEALLPRELVADLLGVRDRGLELTAEGSLPGLIPVGEPFEARDRAGRVVTVEVRTPEHQDGDLAVHLWQLEGQHVTGGYSIVVKA